MPARLLSALSTLLMVVTTTTPVQAACGKGKTPAYGDIEAIRFERTNCYGKCPSYEVLFARTTTDKYECYYVGREYVSKHGTYQADCSSATFQKAVGALEFSDFYQLNYDSSVIVTDVPHYVVGAERCGVTTKLDWPASEKRQDIPSLLDQLDGIANSLRWHRVSNSLESPLSLLDSIP